MSLIVARIQNARIYIVGDTRLTAPNGQVYKKGQHLGPEENVIKTIILNSHHAISFAGNELIAESAIKSIGEDSTPGEIIEVLTKSHVESGQLSEYILSMMIDNEPHIIEIKNGRTGRVQNAWIGSQNGFNEFQGAMLGHKSTPFRQNFVSITDAVAGELMEKMSEAIDAVILDEGIPEVAGFKIKVYFNGERFVYDGYLNTYFAPQQLDFTIPQAQTSFGIPITHGSAEQGGYTINFFNSRLNYNYVGLHVKQGSFGILYSRENNGLLRPRLLENMDEIDFMDYVKPYQISPTGATQDAVQKFGVAAKKLFDLRNYRQASDLYTRGLEHLSGKEKGQFFYNRAICMVRLNRIPDAAADFNEAIKLDSKWQNDAMRIMQDVLNRKR